MIFPLKVFQELRRNFFSSLPTKLFSLLTEHNSNGQFLGCFVLRVPGHRAQTTASTKVALPLNLCFVTSDWRGYQKQNRFHWRMCLFWRWDLELCPDWPSTPRCCHWNDTKLEGVKRERGRRQMGKEEKLKIIPSCDFVFYTFIQNIFPKI